jgi:peptide/nickel transport system permease protein
MVYIAAASPMSGSFASFLVRRLVAVVAVLVGVTACTFLIFHVMQPDRFAAGRPLPLQLWDYVTAVFLHLDLGRSLTIGHRTVSGMVVEGLPADFALLAGGIVIGALAGLAGGAVCALSPRSVLSRCLEGVASVAVCAPVYWVGLMAIYVFSPEIGSIPLPFVGGQGTYAPLTDDPSRWLRGLLVPWFVLAAPLAGMCLRMMRATMQDSLDQDYIRTALGKGLPWARVVRRHAVPTGATPVISLAGVTMATVVTNAVLIERAFNIPGVLRLTTRAMGNVEGQGTVDYPLLQGIVITGALMIVLANLFADLVLAWLDPRVRV